MRATTPRASLRLESLRLNICKDNAPLRPPSVAHKRARQSEVAHKDNELCPIRSSRFPRGDRRYPLRGTRPLPFGGLQRGLPEDKLRALEGTRAEPPTGYKQHLRRDRSESSRGHERKPLFRGGLSIFPTPSTDSLLIPPLCSYREPTCVLTESPQTLLPRALMCSYRERKWALGKSADPLPIPPIQRKLARRERKGAISLYPRGIGHRGHEAERGLAPNGAGLSLTRSHPLGLSSESI